MKCILNFLAPSGAQEMLISVPSSVLRPALTCLELSILIFLSQVSLRSVSGQSQVSLRSVSGQSQVTVKSVSGLEALLTHFIVKSEPKILRLVLLLG